MRSPNENLDEFKSHSAKESDPPSKVTLVLTGETETIKPLARWEGRARTIGGTDGMLRRLSWFHRSLAMGGALTVITFLIGTGLYLAIYGPPIEPTDQSEVAFERQPDGVPTDVIEPFKSGEPTEANVPAAPRKVRFTPLVSKRQAVHAHVFLPAYRPHHEPLQPQMWVSQFVPTTLVIYIENGVVRTRIEPQAGVDYKKPTSSPN